MNKRILLDEMLKVSAELGTAIDLLHPSSVRQARRKLRKVHRRTRRVLNLLKRRSAKGTGKVSNAQDPPVTRPITPPITPPLQIARVDWLRLRKDAKSHKVSYGQIARDLGKPGKWRGLVHHVVHGKRKGSLLGLVAGWALQHGYFLKSAINNPKSHIKRGSHS